MAEDVIPDGRGHEPDTPAVRVIATGAAVVAAMVAVAIGVAIGLGRIGPHGPPTAPTTPNAALQATPAADIAAYRREKEALLHGYGWVDRAQGIVHIPIEQAMALLASRAARGTLRP